MENSPGTVPLEENQKPENQESNYKGLVVSFLALGALTALILFPKPKLSLLGGLSKINPLSKTEIQPTPTVLALKTYLVTNNNNNQDIFTGIGESVNLELRLNKNALNSLQITNGNVLREENALTYNQEKDVYQSTLKTLAPGESTITVIENAKINIFKVKVFAQ